MAGEQTIQIRGLRELNRNLKKMDRELSKEMSKGLADVAQFVLDRAKPLVPRDSGDAQASMKVRKSPTEARLAVGGTKAPYFPWLDFGGRVGRNKSLSRPVISGGRYIYPTVAKHDRQIKEMLDKVLEDLARRGGFEQRGKSF